MTSRKIAIERQFNRSAASSYDTHAKVQQNMSSILSTTIKQSRSAKAASALNIHILEIGCGTGDLTERLIKEWPNATITAMDIAPEMLRVADERIQSGASCYQEGAISRVQFVHADVESWAYNAPAESFDLIASNACFQWLSDPGQTLKQLSRLLSKGGLLAFSTFGPDTFRELHASFHEAYRMVGRTPQRHGLTFHSGDEWRRLLIQAGFPNAEYERIRCREEYASARDFLLSVKGQGASTSEAAASGGGVSRRLFSSMFEVYENNFSTASGIEATYELLFLQASSNL